MNCLINCCIKLIHTSFDGNTLTDMDLPILLVIAAGESGQGNLDARAGDMGVMGDMQADRASACWSARNLLRVGSIFVCFT